MDWTSGFSSKYYMTIVDPNTWKDMDVINIKGGTISRVDSDLRGSADINCVRYNTTKEQLIRVWLDTKQNGSTSHTPLFTGYATSPANNIDGVVVTNTVQCYSILKPAQDILLPRGWYAPKASDSEALIRELLAPTKAPIKMDSSDPPRLSQALIAEENENNLSMADLIIYWIGWRMRIFGDGSIHIGPKATDASVTFDSISNDIIEKSLTITYDWYDCPNVFRAIVDDEVAIARDEDPNSIFSIPSRGREVWAEETNCELNENESITEYADRHLKELQQVATTLEYDRRFFPDVYPSDIVRINYPANNLTGLYQVASQTINLEFGARTSEEAVKWAT